MSPEAMESLLRERGCSITAPRRAILSFLADNDSHPTAAEVFDAVTRDDPQASRATVYNTLALLTEIGAVRVVRVGEADARFDPNVDHHHHAICPTCGRIEDVGAHAVEVRLEGAIAAGARVQFERKCARCR